MATWMTMDEACTTLGVKPQTVYAYVSRGKLGVTPDPANSRRSLYRAEDVATLARRKRDGRSHEALAANTLTGAEPSIPTAISTFVRGLPCYRGQDVLTLARTATLEDAAALLWDAAEPPRLARVAEPSDTAAAEPSAPAAPPSDSARIPAEPGRLRAFTWLAARAASGHSGRGRLSRLLHDEAGALVGGVGEAFGAQPDDGRPLHLRLAAGWRASRAVAELLRVALVLVADHELTASAFAARIAASTGASLPACLLAGLSTLSGPLHGDASGRVRTLFDDVAHRGEDAVVDHHLASALPIAGFGHHLYPDGDPRARALLALFEPPPAIARFIAKVTALTGLQPNIDVAMAALVLRHRLPDDAAFGVIATARSVGLLAHAMEQLDSGQPIRPRGRYCGPAPVLADGRDAPQATR